MRILYLLSDPTRGGQHRQTGYMTHVREIVAALERAGHQVALFDARAARNGSAETAGEKNADATLARAEGAAAGDGVVTRVPKPLRAVGRDLLYWWRNRELASALERACAGRSFDLVYERFHHFQDAGGRWAHRHGVPHFLEFNAGQDEIAAFHGAGLAAWARRSEDRVLVLHNAADPNRFRPDLEGQTARRRLGIDAAELVVGFIGSFAAWHGVERLIEAAADPRLRALPVRLVLAGAAPGTPAERAVAERVRREGLEERVLLVGRVPHDEIPELLAAVDVAVMPWTNEYGSPLKLFEYMAMGKAIVAPDRPVIREILAPGSEALLAGADQGELTEAILRLATEPDLRRRLAASVRQRVEREHNWDHHAALIEQEWKKLREVAPSKTRN
jgi:glycosyltransferase involved in cell wall biosynthesis